MIIKDYRALDKIARRAACIAVYARFKLGLDAIFNLD